VQHALIVVACVLFLGGLRERLFLEHRRVHETSEVYALSSPEQVVRMSLGYRSALADYLWSNVLVVQGLRLQEKRRFEAICDYFDAINALDPTFRDPYLHVDSLVTLQPGRTEFDEIRRARVILERGVEARPDDAEVWLNLGQFVGFIAPAGGYLPDAATKQAWRTAGAEYLARAAELGSEDANVSWQALGGASILKHAGERDAAIRFLRRTLAVTDDEELRRSVEIQLFRLLDERGRDSAVRRKSAYDDLVRSDVPVRSHTERLLIGPPRWAHGCAGRGAEQVVDPRPACATSWEEWARAIDAELARSR